MTATAATRRGLLQVSLLLRAGIAEQQRRPDGWGGQKLMPAVQAFADLLDDAATGAPTSRPAAMVQGLVDLFAAIAATSGPTDRPLPQMAPDGVETPPVIKSEQRLLTYAQVAEVLGLSAVTVARRVKEGEIVGLRIGSNVRVLSSDLDAYIAAQRSQDTPGAIRSYQSPDEPDGSGTVSP